MLYLFGTPGQDRFWFMWDELATARSARSCWPTPGGWTDCFPSVDYFEQRGIPFVVAVNCFDGRCDFTADEINTALNLRAPAPIIMCDVRHRSSSKDVLLALLESARTQAAQRMMSAN